MSEPVRINKYLAEHHYCSRREADRLIASGNVFLNNRPARLGDKVGDEDVVRVNGRERGIRQNKIYLMLNKPAGISIDKRKEDNIFDLIDSNEKFFPVGNMHVQEEGLLILTNDSFFSKKLSDPKFNLDQEFVVEVDRDLRRIDVSKMQNGLKLKDGLSKEAKVRQIDLRRFAIILSESKPNLIPRMCEELGYKAITIMRTRIITLKMISTYPVGNSRNLTESEVSSLKKIIGMNNPEKQKTPGQKKSIKKKPQSGRKKTTR